MGVRARAIAGIVRVVIVVMPRVANVMMVMANVVMSAMPAVAMASEQDVSRSESDKCCDDQQVQTSFHGVVL